MLINYLFGAPHRYVVQAAQKNELTAFFGPIAFQKRRVLFGVVFFLSLMEPGAQNWSPLFFFYTRTSKHLAPRHGRFHVLQRSDANKCLVHNVSSIMMGHVF